MHVQHLTLEVLSWRNEKTIIYDEKWDLESKKTPRTFTAKWCFRAAFAYPGFIKSWSWRFSIRLKKFRWAEYTGTWQGNRFLLAVSRLLQRNLPNLTALPESLWKLLDKNDCSYFKGMRFPRRKRFQAGEFFGGNLWYFRDGYCQKRINTHFYFQRHLYSHLNWNSGWTKFVYNFCLRDPHTPCQ